MAGKTISHYEILEELGRGGMGVVYRAKDLRLDREVALKFLSLKTADETEKARFIHEAKASSKLDHSNICTVHEIDETPEGELFIVMACYDGETLKDMIRRGPLPVEKAMDFAVQIAEGLREAHDHEIVHRDIKSANIMVTSRGQVKIMDFGLALLSSGTRLTKTGTTLGTVSYMSPEQAKGERVDRRADVWSLGVLLYEMLTGQLPFKGEYEQAVVYSILDTEPEPVTGLRTGIPLELEHVVVKALAKDPDKRYSSMDELLVDFRRIDWKKKEFQDRQVRRDIKTERKVLYRALPLLGVLLLVVTVLFFLFREKGGGGTREIPRLVVLPFENLGQPEDNYFANGITEEIMSNLSTIGNLGVISRSSAFHYAGSDKPIRQIGEELKVQYAVTGSVQWSRNEDAADRVRIIPSLIRISDDIQLWSQSFDRVVDDIFSIQSEIALNVVKQLGLTLGDSEKNLIESRPTQNLEAYHAFLRARHYAQQPHFTVEGWKNVIRSYEQAISIDPGFALAYAELSKAHARFHYLRYDLSQERQDMAREAAEKALKLAPGDPEVRLALGYYYLWSLMDDEKALEEWTLAEKGLPNNPLILEAKVSQYELKGQWQEAMNTAEKAFLLSPNDASFAVELAYIYWLNRDYPLADKYCNEAAVLAPEDPWSYLFKAFMSWSWKGKNEMSGKALLSVSPEHEWYVWAWFWEFVSQDDYHKIPDLLARTPGTWSRNKCWAMPESLFMAYMYSFTGENAKAKEAYEAARADLEKEIEKWPEDPRLHSSLGTAYAGLGRFSDAVREGKLAVDLLPVTRDAFYGVVFETDLASIYCMTGDLDLALKKIEYLFSIPCWLSPAFLSIDPRFEPVYGHPGWPEVKRKYIAKNR